MAQSPDHDPLGRQNPHDEAERLERELAAARWQLRVMIGIVMLQLLAIVVVVGPLVGL